DFGTERPKCFGLLGAGIATPLVAAAALPPDHGAYLVARAHLRMAVPGVGVGAPRGAAVGLLASAGGRHAREVGVRHVAFHELPGAPLHARPGHRRSDRAGHHADAPADADDADEVSGDARALDRLRADGDLPGPGGEAPPLPRPQLKADDR